MKCFAVHEVSFLTMEKYITKQWKVCTGGAEECITRAANENWRSWEYICPYTAMYALHAHRTYCTCWDLPYSHTAQSCCCSFWVVWCCSTVWPHLSSPKSLSNRWTSSRAKFSLGSKAKSTTMLARPAPTSSVTAFWQDNRAVGQWKPRQP
jgi:hypothetical protein